MKNFSNTGGMRLFFYVGEINFGAAGRDGPGALWGKAPANGVPSCPALQIRLDVLNIDVRVSTQLSLSKRNGLCYNYHEKILPLQRFGAADEVTV